MSKGIKIIAVIAVILLVLAIVLFGAWRWFTHQAIPIRQGNVDAAGLDQEVEIIRDELGVAHIYAHTPEDLFFTQGYVHARSDSGRWSFNVVPDPAAFRSFLVKRL